jgi:N-formylglutamate deformylase
MQDPFEAVSIQWPEPQLALPLVCDSPHSGTDYPADFRAALPMALLRQAEDTHVAELWSSAVEVGATMIAARFPRSYIDPNRAVDDLDPALMDGDWPTALAPGEKSRLGFGLVWSKVDACHPIYGRRLSVAEVQQRIARCWQPYRHALAQEIECAARQFGSVWHLNLHSMPDNAYARLGIKAQRPLADFVLGDRDGSTCDPEFIDVVERSLRSFGYSVARNDPYRGTPVLLQTGQPALGRHSLQIEIRRPLYMDEATRERNALFHVLQWQLGHTMRNVAQYVHYRLAQSEQTQSSAALSCID